MTHELPTESGLNTLARLDLSDDVERLVESMEASEFDWDDSSSYTYTDPKFVDHVWLPVDLAVLTTTNQTSPKKIDVSYVSEPGNPRSGMAVVLYLTNGERITLTKQVDDSPKIGFDFSYSDSTDTLGQIENGDVARIVTSLVFPELLTSDTTMSHLLDTGQSKLDPTDPLLSPYILQQLQRTADSWRREQGVELSLEDDNNVLRIVKSTNSTGDGAAYITFSQSELGPDGQNTFKTSLVQSIDSPNPEVSYMGTGVEPGTAEEKPYFYDYMRAVVRLANTAIRTSSAKVLSYEMETRRILKEEARGKFLD